MQAPQNNMWESLFFGVLDDSSLVDKRDVGAYALQKKDSDYRFIVCYRSGMKIHATDATNNNLYDFLLHYNGVNDPVVSINNNFVLVNAKNIKLSILESYRVGQFDASSLRSVYSIIQSYETLKQDFKFEVNTRIKRVNQIIGVLEKDYHRFQDVS
jgi:hypothetical protein